jgi:hypothetical protein
MNFQSPEAMYARSIRRYATSLVGPCSDYEISFVAAHLGVVSEIVLNLDKLDAHEQRKLWVYVVQEVRRDR